MTYGLNVDRFDCSHHDHDTARTPSTSTQHRRTSSCQLRCQAQGPQQQHSILEVERYPGRTATVHRNP
eukprot:3174396-Prymnesium_polylepis.1